MQVVKNSYLAADEDVNVIGERASIRKIPQLDIEQRELTQLFRKLRTAVDWSEMANDNNYLKSAASARSVGRNIANVIDFMVNEHGADLDDFHLIGHSLGEGFHFVEDTRKLSMR